MRKIVFAALVIAACTNDATQPTTLGLSFSVVSGDGQSGIVGQPLPNPLVIKATDSRGKALRNVLVEFSVTSGGGSASPATATTNNQGLAQTSWTLGTSTTTAQRLETRAVSNGALFGTFSATALPDAAAQLTHSAGDSQTVARLTAVPIAPAVLVADQYGNPVSGVTVNFSVLAGGGTLIGPTPVTGASGVATVGSWTLGSTVGAQTLRAAVAGVSPVTFTATATVGAGARMVLHAGNNQNAPVHWNLAVPPAVRITDGAGNPIQGIQATFSRLDTNSVFVDSMPVSDVNGIARVQAWTMGSRLGLVAARVTAPGIADTVLLSARATAGIPASITIAGGNNQSAHVGYAVETPPSVLVRDSSSNPVQGYGVQFEVTSGGGSVFGSSTTDSNGIARAGVWFLGPNPGPNTLRATVAWVVESVEFTATGTVGPVDSSESNTVVNPSTITVSTGSEVATVTVTARDALRRPVPSAHVVLYVGGHNNIVTPPEATTDANGVAVLTVSSTEASARLVYAIIDGVATVRRLLYVVNGPPVSITVRAGDNQTAVAGTPVAIQPSIVVRDTFGNGANTVGVSFAVTGGGGSISGPGTVNTTTFGVATIGGWTLGVTPGPNSLTATVDGTTLTTTFNATGSPNAASIEVFAGDGQSAAPGTDVAIAPAVLARDAAGNPMSGAIVDFAVAAGSGFIPGPTTRTTGADGTARVDAWTLGEYATNRLTARVEGTELSVTFSATGAGSKWDRLADLPTPRMVLGAATVNGIVYAVGGLFEAYVANADAYDPATNTWTPRAPMPTVRGEIGVGVVNGVLYAVGGNNGSGYDVTTLRATVEAYDPATNTWTTRAPMPTPRAGLAVVVVDGILYAIGGLGCRPPAGEPCGASSPVGLVATVEAYDPATNSWTTKASMPTPRAYVGAAAIDGVIYAAGGQGDASLFVSNVEAYNPSLDTWTVRAPLPTGRLGLGAEVVNGQLYAIGGYGAGYNEGRTVEAYDAASNTWTVLPPMPVGRWFLATTVLNGAIYILGGTTPELVETFRP